MTMTNTRFPWRPGWRSGRGLGSQNRTRISYEDAGAHPPGAGGGPRTSSISMAKEHLDCFRKTVGYSSDEEEFFGYSDSSIEDSLSRYYALVRSSRVLMNTSIRSRQPSSAANSEANPSAITSSDSALLQCRLTRTAASSALSSAPDPDDVTRFGAAAAAAAEALSGPVSRSSNRTTYSSSSSSNPLLGTVDDQILVYRHGDIDGAAMTDAEASSSVPATDWNHNRTPQKCRTKRKSLRPAKIRSMWICRRKGFERKFFRKKDLGGPEKTAVVRRLEGEENYLSRDYAISGRISPDSGNDSAQSNSCSPSDSSLFWRSSPLTFQLPRLTSSLPPLASAAVDEDGARQSTTTHLRKRRCRRCPGCLAVDCGNCYACRDMLKYGGRGISKQACCQRRCRQPVNPYNHHEPQERLVNMKTRSPSSDLSLSTCHQLVTKSVTTGVGLSDPEIHMEVTPLNVSCMEVQKPSEPLATQQSPQLPNKMNSILRPSALSTISSLSLGQQLQKKAVSASETVDRDVIWQSVVRLVDDCLMEQMRQKREIDKNLEDSLYSSIRDLVKTLLPPVPDEGSLLNCDERFEETTTGCARALPFKARKPRDMFSFLLSQHRQQLSDAGAPAKASEETNFDLMQRRIPFGGEISAKGRFRLMDRRPLGNTVYVARSQIHSRGLFGARNIEAGEAVVEYTGEVIRSVLTDKRERHYEDLGVGCYMFRLDKLRVVDATLVGSAARFINHSCEPNCYSRVVQSLSGVKHIVIFSLRDIKKGEELTYDYKFPIENIKIPCSCGSRKCRKYLN